MVKKFILFDFFPGTSGNKRKRLYFGIFKKPLPIPAPFITQECSAQIPS